VKIVYKVVESERREGYNHRWRYTLYQRKWWGGWEKILETDIWDRVQEILGGPSTRYFNAFGKEICQ